MKISMWSSFLYGRTFESIIPAMSNAGFDSMDLSTEHLAELTGPADGKKRALQWKQMALDHNIPLLQTHLLLDADLSLQGIAGQKQLDILKRELEMTMLMEIPAAVIHAGTRDQDEENAAGILLQLCDFLRGSSTALALENLLEYDTRAEDLKKRIRLAGNHPKLGICLDTGHLHVTGGDPVEFLREGGPLLIALHIADNPGDKDLHMLPLGRGTVPWRPFMLELKSMDYKGIFNFEASGENSSLYPEILDHKLRYAAEVARVLLAME